MATISRPRSQAAQPIPITGGCVESQVTELLERERLLRGLLLDARDALLRSRLGPEPAPPQAAPPAPARRSPAAAAADYPALRRRLRALLEARVPGGGQVLVVSRGDPQLVELEGRRGLHFPDDGYGGYAGHHPADDAAVIRQLERRRRHGAEFLALPETELWWLEHYRELARHLERSYRKHAEESGTGVVYDLREPAAPPRAESGEPVVTKPRPRRRPLAAATIISRNYLAQARVLARSFLEHEPDGRFYLLIVDRLPDGEQVGVDVEVVDPRDLEIPSFYEMCFKYGVIELSTAVKPFLLSHIFGEHGEEEVVFFDPDILIVRPLTELREALDEGEIVLTPHITAPLPLDGKRPSEQDIMISGAYNLGFIALRKSPQTQRFLAWWEERLQDGCRIDVPRGLFTDQKWIDLVPSLFPGTVILRDTSYNVAFWNLHEREVTLRDGRFEVNGRPAAFFHISGFDPKRPEQLSKHQTRIEVPEGSALARLLERYGARLKREGYEKASGWGYGYERFSDGSRVHPLLRQIYLNLSPGERRRFGDPFVTGEPSSFLDWATRPGGERGALSRFLETIYKVRYDLPLHFPDVRGRDRGAFLRWARRWGAAEMGFDPGLVRDEAAPGTAPAEAARPKAAAGRAPGRPAARGRAGGPVASKPAPPRKPGKAAVPARPVPAAPPRSAATSYEALVERVRNVVSGLLPAGSRVLVISKGDYRLVDLAGCEGWHFPQTADGVYGGYNPPDSGVAVAHLEALRERGAGYLLIPRTALWWLEYYEDFRRHLETRYRLVARDLESCLVYSLRERPGAGRWSLGRLTRRWSGWPIHRQPAAAAAAAPGGSRA